MLPSPAPVISDAAAAEVVRLRKELADREAAIARLQEV